MDPQDRLRLMLDGIACSVCEASVGGERIRLLARREDLAFIEIACPACGSTTLAFAAGEGDALHDGRPVPPVPVSADDVLDMHLLLESWQGDLLGLLNAASTPDAGPPR